MKNKIIIGLAMIGIFLRIYPAIIQPLWLDEFYSLYFASKFTLLQLIFGLPDVHQGGYYLFLKFVLLFTTNPFLLRFFTSVLPGLIGCYLLYILTKNKPLSLIVLFNPIFINFSWSLRMYGLTTLLSVLFLYILYLNYSPKKLLLFAVISTFFSFSFVIPLFIYCIYYFIKSKNKYYILIPFIPIFEFIVFKGIHTYRVFTQQASWISPPTLNNFSSTILTSLGFLTDVNNIGSFNILISLALITFIIIFGFMQNRTFHLFVTSPFIFTVIVSILFPFLSQHFFFYQFIPKISVFFPRFLLPLSIFFYFFVINKLTINKAWFIFCILLLVWIRPYQILNFNYLTPSLDTSLTKSIILPPWENLNLHTNFNYSDIKIMSSRYDFSLVVETSLIKNICADLPPQSTITYLPQTIASLNQYQTQMKNNLNKCYKSIRLNTWQNY